MALLATILLTSNNGKHQEMKQGKLKDAASSNYQNQDIAQTICLMLKLKELVLKNQKHQ